MSPFIIAAALSALALSAGTASAQVHHPARAKFDDTEIEVINNGGPANEMLCADRAIVGSRFIRHICYTRAQWSRLKAEQHFHTDKMLRRIGEDGGMPGGVGDPAHPQGADNPQ